MRPLFFLCPLVLVGLVASGCAATRPAENAAPLIDSLRAENTRLRSQVRALADSLQFRENLETGQYYRELRTLKDRLNRRTYEVRSFRSGGQTITVLPADSLFEAASATLTPSGAERLRSIASRLQTTYPNRAIRVEGHADDTPLSETLQEQFPSNWELSSARAAAVVRHLIEYSPLDPGQFVAAGYGTARPVASNETAAGRRRNRRVRVAVLPSPQEYSRPFETAW